MGMEIFPYKTLRGKYFYEDTVGTVEGLLLQLRLLGVYARLGWPDTGE